MGLSETTVIRVATIITVSFVFTNALSTFHTKDNPPNFMQVLFLCSCQRFLKTDIGCSIQLNVAVLVSPTLTF